MLRIFGAAIMMAVSEASTVEYGVPEYFNNKCFHCIDDGYMFCSADGISGTCIDVTCQEYSLDQEEKDKAKAAGKCTVVPADKTK